MSAAFFARLGGQIYVYIIFKVVVSLFLPSLKRLMVALGHWDVKQTHRLNIVGETKGFRADFTGRTRVAGGVGHFSGGAGDRPQDLIRAQTCPGASHEYPRRFIYRVSSFLRLFWWRSRFSICVSLEGKDEVVRPEAWQVWVDVSVVEVEWPWMEVLVVEVRCAMEVRACRLQPSLYPRSAAVDC